MKFIFFVIWVWANYFEHWDFSYHSSNYIKYSITHSQLKFRIDSPNPSKLGDGSSSNGAALSMAMMRKERREFEYVYYIEIIIIVMH